MSKFIGLILVIALFSAPSHAFWSRCGNILGPQSITSPSCSGSICTLNPGTTSNFAAVIQFARAHTALRTRVMLFVQGTPVEIPIPPPLDNTCAGMTPGCPTSPNSVHTYNFGVPISSNPAFRGNTRARVEIFDGSNVEVCVDIDVVIT